MKTVVFVGSHKSGSSYEAIRAADGMGYYTVLLTDRPSFIDKRIEFPHAHSVRLCGLDSPGEVKRAVERLAIERFHINAIVSFIDPYCHTAAVLSREYGLKRFSEDAIEVMLDKTKSKQALDGTPYSAFYQVADSPSLASNTAREMPLVLKSPVSSGSKDVHLVCTARQYRETFNQLRGQYPDVPVLVEKFLDGPQYLVETLTVGGTVSVVAIIEQEITFTGRFIVTGYRMVTHDGDAFCRSLKAAAADIVKAHGMSDGPCHLELRRFNGGWKLIEANPRISGGAMNAFIETAYGLDLAGETLKFALGLEPDLRHRYKRDAYLQYLVTPEGGVLEKVTGRNAALNSPGVERVYVKPRKGAVLSPPLSMGYRYAYVIATGESGDAAEDNAKNAASKIKFHLYEDDG